MNQLYQKIKEGIQNLPPKDSELSTKFLANRDFERLKGIVDSCLYMKRQDDIKETHKEKWAVVDRDKLEELALILTEYMSYLDIPDNSEESEDYY